MCGLWACSLQLRRKERSRGALEHLLGQHATMFSNYMIHGPSPAISRHSCSHRQMGCMLTKAGPMQLPSDPSRPTLSILTWNTSDDMVSASATNGWASEQQRQGIAQHIVHLQPDVVCLQELQNTSSGIPALLDEFYTAHGQASSHRGSCQTFLRKASKLQVVGKAETVGPATLLQLQIENHRVSLANCHLEPFTGGSTKRARQMEALVQSAQELDNGSQEEKKHMMIIAGDTNMRAREEATIEKALGLEDAWAATGRRNATKYTCDMFRNLYFKDGFKYTSRYDRIFFKGTGMQCNGLELVGDKPIGPGHYLSDHFGVLATMTFPKGSDH